MAMSFLKFFGERKTSDGRYVRWPRRTFHHFGAHTVVDEDTSMQVAAFNRGLIYISTQIAKLPWSIKDASDKIIPNTPIGSLLNLSANPEVNAFFFRVMMIQQAIIHGNAYAEIERDTIGRPIALWPLLSQGMRIVRNYNTGGLEYHYVNNLFGGPQEPVILQPDEVFHLKNFHTKDAIVGQGIVSYGREVLGINIATDEMAGGIFRNGGVPSGILQHKGKLSDEAYKRLKESWSEQFNGKKQGGTAILEEDMAYTPVNIPPDALQFLQSRQFGVLEIARFLGLPPTKLYDVVAAKYANVENANLEVATDTLHAWAVNLEMEADVKILNERYGGRYTEIDLYEIFRGDMVTRSSYFKAMMSIGSMTPNEIRSREGMASYKEGDNFYIATNNFTPVDRMDELIDADIEQKTKGPAPKEDTSENKPGSEDDSGGNGNGGEDDQKTKAELRQAAIKYLSRK